MREEQRRASELENQLETNRQELTRIRGQLDEFHEQGEILREEQQRVLGLQNQLETSQQELTRIREQLNEFHEQGELLREEQRRVLGLQNQLETSQQEWTRLREQLNEFQRQGEQQGVIELTNQLQTIQQQLTTSREQLNRLRRQDEGPRGRQQRAIPEMLTQDCDWIIYRREIVTENCEELGRGAWGAVFRGKFRGCDVAVKELHANIISDNNRRLFEREIEIASKCRHPCLLQFIGATADDGVPLLITEIMDRSLKSRLFNVDEPALTSTEVCVISLDVALALNYLHQEREPIIHHDVSSGNVLLWRQGDQWRAKVSDYGTANFVRQSTINYAGAAIYQAPECLNGNINQPLSCKVSEIPDNSPRSNVT